MNSTYLSSRDIQQFHELGFVGPFPLIEEAEIEMVLKKLWLAKAKVHFWDKLLSSSFILNNLFREKRWGRAKWMKGTSLVSEYTYRLSANPKILDKVESLLGPSIIQWGSLLITQKSGVIHPWHTDLECLDSGGLTVWVALKNTSLAASMKVITRTHHLATHPKQLNWQSGLDITNDQAVLQAARELDEKCEQITLDVKPGEFVIMPCQIWHSTVNQSQLPRSAVIFQYASTNTEIKMLADSNRFPIKWDSRPIPCCLMRGRDEFGKNQIVPPHWC